MLTVVLFASLAIGCSCTLTGEYYPGASEDYSSNAGDPLFTELYVLRKDELKLWCGVDSLVDNAFRIAPIYNDEGPYFRSPNEGDFKLHSILFEFPPAETNDDSRVLFLFKNKEGNKEWTVISKLFKQPKNNPAAMGDSLRNAFYANTLNKQLVHDIKMTGGGFVTHNINWVVQFLKRQPPSYTYSTDEGSKVFSVGMPIVVKEEEVIAYFERRKG